MKNIWTICSRELKAYFLSPIAYVISFFWLAWMGFWFWNVLASTQEASLRQLLSVFVFLLIFLLPALTMRLLAEEQRMGTIELLLTAPVHDWQIIIGKYLGSLITYVALLVAPTLWYVGVLFRYGQPDYAPLATGYLGMVLLGASFLAIGLFTSSLTQNQVVAYVLSFIIMLFLWVANAANNTLALTGGSVGDVLQYLAIPSHTDSLNAGVIDTKDLVYSLSLIALSLFLATQTLQSRRWR